MKKLGRVGIGSIVILAGLGALGACAAHDSPTPSQPPAPASATAASAAQTGFNVPGWATPKALVGRVAASTLLTVQVHMRMQNEAAAAAELADITDPDSASYGNFLSDDDFNAKYAPTAADYAAVQSHLTSHGLTVIDTPDNRAYVTARGTAADVEAAFSTQLGQYQIGGALKRAPSVAASLPASIMPAVKGVLGLAEPVKMKPMMKRAMHSGGSGPVTVNTCSAYYGQVVDTIDPPLPGGPSPLTYVGCPYTPPQIRAMYGVDPSLDGTGQTIAIVDAFLAPTLLADAQQYAKNNDPTHPLPASQFTVYPGPGTPPPASCDETVDAEGWWGEQSLDVEAVHALAPGAKIAFVAAQSDDDQDLLAALNLIISKRLAYVVSNSWSSQEAGGDDFATYESVAIQAGLKGIGLYFATGDSGDNAFEEAQDPAGPQGATVGFPPSLPEVTGVGGTSLALDQGGGIAFETGWENGEYLVVPAGYDGTWPPAGSQDDGDGCEPDGGLAPPPSGGGLPTVADGGAAQWWPTVPGGFAGGSNGGTSQIYLEPSWQKGIVPDALATQDPNLSGPGAPARVVPDVAMLADPNTGFNVGETFDGQYSEEGSGGTSLATPLFTAAMALAQQYTGRHFGSANPLLYKASKHGAFRDVGPTATTQAVAFPLYGAVISFGYTGPEDSLTCTKGFDNETGLGSPNGKGFFAALKAH